jgi:opine dehydrogenase
MKKNHKYKIAIIGAGNGGQAMAGHLALMGHSIILYNRNIEKIGRIQENKGIYLTGVIEGFGPINKTTDKLSEAISESEIIMIVTTADAHAQIAHEIIPYLQNEQIIVLNPGRTGGALEMRKIFNDEGLSRKVYIAECQSLVYACRQEIPGTVRIIGVKDRVYYATFPNRDIALICGKLESIYKCFIPVENILVTSLENIGAIFHPTIVIFNASRIERSEEFYFYNDITPAVCSILENVDKERLMIGEAFGLKLLSAEEWISYAYKGIAGKDLLSKMMYNPAYYKILGPKKLNSRMLLEDIPTGIFPMIELGKLAELELPLMNAILNLAEGLLGINLRLKGRNLERLGLNGLTKSQIINLVND